MYKEIWNIIYDKLLLNTKFAEVANEEKTALKSFPACIIYPANSRHRIADQTSFSNNINYKIRIYVQNKNRSVMEQNIRELVDDVITDLKTIPATCDMTYADIDVEWWRTEDEQPLRLAEILISGYVLD